MIKKNLSLLLTLLFSLVLSSGTYAQNSYELGAVMTSSQISALGNMRSFVVGGTTFRILPTPTTSGGNVINEQGKIGRCEGDVLISGIPTDQAKKALAPYQASIASIKVYDSLKMVSARFSDLVDAANVRNELANSAPDARVTLPVVFSLPQAR